MHVLIGRNRVNITTIININGGKTRLKASLLPNYSENSLWLNNKSDSAHSRQK
jgi:hypothetical protein